MTANRIRYMKKVILLTMVCHAFNLSQAQTVDADSLMKFWLNIYDESSCLSHWTEEPIYRKELLAKANPDECYNGIGNPFISDPLSSQGIPKVNDAYIWGMTKSGNDLWFGTVANTLCGVIWLLGEEFGRYPAPYETSSIVCEFDQSQYPPEYSDWRPPHIYLYDTHTGILSDVTPDDPLIESTSGIRSAGSLDDVVFLGGPGKDEGVVLFAFNTVTKEFIRAREYPEFANIRQWLVVNGELYTAVLNAGGGGSVLRWTGNATEPFQFEIVGNLNSEGVYMAYHEDRIFIITWPILKISQLSLAPAYLVMSPVIPSGGLTQAHADGWEKVWEPSDYEPDFITSLTYGGGALASFDGYLYWGTMHVPFAATIGHLIFYAQEDSLETFLGSYRPISIFRGRNFTPEGGEIELLYGLSHMPKYVPTIPILPRLGGRWEITPNKMGAEPLFGPAGFCNFYNNYTWAMTVFQGQLFVGTMDWSYMYNESMPELLEAFQLPFQSVRLQLPPYQMGGDLFRFPDAGSRAYAESLTGVGNYSSYGIRTMLANEAVYLGMANSMNLLTDTNDDLPEGGWELIRLDKDADVLDQANDPPGEFELSQNYPNPFNPSTMITIDLPRACFVRLKIYDVMGREVETIIDERRAAGRYEIRWSMAGLSSGIYFCRLEAGDFIDVKKIVLQR